MKKSTARFLTAACATIMGAGMTFSTPTAVPCDNNPDRSRGAKAFKKSKSRKKTADKSKRTNRRKH